MIGRSSHMARFDWLNSAFMTQCSYFKPDVHVAILWHKILSIPGPPLYKHCSDKIVVYNHADIAHKQYSSPSILQPSILRPPLIIRPLDLIPKGTTFCVK